MYEQTAGLFASRCILRSVHKVDLLMYLSRVLLSGQGLKLVIQHEEAVTVQELEVMVKSTMR